MKTMKKRISYIFIAMFMVMGLVSCQSDGVIASDISGLYGRLWEVDLGEDSRTGYPLFSEFMFQRGSSVYHGAGYEERFYQDNERLYDRATFDWEVSNGDLLLYYGGGDIMRLRNIVTYSDRFTASIERGAFRERVTFYLVGSRLRANRVKAQQKDTDK